MPKVFVSRDTYVKGRHIAAPTVIDVDEGDAKLLKEARKSVPYDAANKAHAAALKKAREEEEKAEKAAAAREKQAAGE